MTEQSTSVVRVRFDFAYDGTNFSGWAKQPGLRTVQGDFEQALTGVVGLPIALTVAGRTDAGVHALGQVAHADLPRLWWDKHGDRLGRRLRREIPTDIVLHKITAVPMDFDARFAAISRTYEYRVIAPPENLDPRRRGFVYQYPWELSLADLNRASSALLGLRDFAAFCRPRPGATTIRDLTTFAWHADGAELVAQVTADAFCHSMVRSLVGAVLAVGANRRTLAWLDQMLAAELRSSSITVAPAHGLTLVTVNYPELSQLAARTRQTKARRELS